MRLSEQRLWDTMRRRQPAGTWCERIENMVGDGHPDVNVYSLGRITYAELKAPQRPARDTSKLFAKDEVRLSQVNWHLKIATMCINSYFLIRDDTGSLYLVPGCHAAQLDQATVEQVRELSIADNWPDVWAIIC